MKCPICGADSQVLQTRNGAHEATQRRRQCSRNHRFSTYEIHSPAFSNVQPRVAAYAAAAKNRIERWQRDEAIVNDPRSSSAVALDYGMTSWNVRRIRRTHT